MKQCPACKTTYTDETLSYCLVDGKLLGAVIDEQATVVNPTAGQQMRVEIPQDMSDAKTLPAGYFPGSAAPAGSSGGGLRIFFVLLAVFLLVGAIVVVLGIVFYVNGIRPEISSATNTTNRTANATPLPSATKDDKEELREQIANLEKRLSDQKTNNQPANIPLSLPNQPAATSTARVNSPGDGFLALRTFPSSDAGSRILQIPHGAVLTVGGCLNSMRIGRKTGRWCRASYNGYSGWVFDAFLVF